MSAALLALVLLLAAMPARPAPSPARLDAPAAPSALQVHAPILIDGDAAFTAANGVVRGNGTPADPYVIQGWDITPVGADGIQLHNTTAVAVLRDLVIHGSDPAHVDVWLYGASNVTVENVTATGSAQGIYLYLASHVTVRACHAPYHDGGSVAILESDHVLVDGNDGGYANWGVSVRQSSDVAVTNNRMANVTEGIVVEASTLMTITANRVTNGSVYGNPPAGILVRLSPFTVMTGNDVVGMPGTGIRVENSTGVTMTANNLTENGIGAAFLTASGIVTHNRFLFNNVSSVDDLGNPWDAGYPTGGNYWSDYGGVDHCRGPAQDDCTGTDGIGDTPYVVNGSVRDRYPLMFYDLPPHVTINAPAGALAGRDVAFHAAILDPAGTMASVAWDFGDGSTGSGETATHAYSLAGTYGVHVLVTDNRSLTAQASASIEVWPAVSFVTVSHSSGFQLPIPADWETHTDYVLGGEKVPVASLGPTVDAFRTNLLVSYLDDSSVKETPAYLSDAVNGTLAAVRQQQPTAYLSGPLAFVRVSGHAAVEFTIAYSGASYAQRAALVVSADHGRAWVILLSTATSDLPAMNLVFDVIVAGFTITALPTLVVVALVGGLAAAAVAGVVFVVVRIRKRRAAKARLSPAPAPPMLAPPGSVSPVVPPIVSQAFCTSCGARLEAGMPFCGKCGTRVGGGPPPAG